MEVSNLQYAIIFNKIVTGLELVIDGLGRRLFVTKVKYIDPDKIIEECTNAGQPIQKFILDEAINNLIHSCQPFRIPFYGVLPINQIFPGEIVELSDSQNHFIELVKVNTNSCFFVACENGEKANLSGKYIDFDDNLIMGEGNKLKLNDTELYIYKMRFLTGNLLMRRLDSFMMKKLHRHAVCNNLEESLLIDVFEVCKGRVGQIILIDDWKRLSDKAQHAGQDSFVLWYLLNACSHNKEKMYRS